MMHLRDWHQVRQRALRGRRARPGSTPLSPPHCFCTVRACRRRLPRS